MQPCPFVSFEAFGQRQPVKDIRAPLAAAVCCRILNVFCDISDGFGMGGVSPAVDKLGFQKAPEALLSL